MPHFIYFFIFLAFHAINKTNSSEISTSVKSFKKNSLYTISSLDESEKQNIPNTLEFFAKIKAEEEQKEQAQREETKKNFFIKLVDCINTNDTQCLSDLLSNQNKYDFSWYQDEFGYTLLDYAIMNRNKKAVFILLEHSNFQHFPFKKSILLNLLSFKNPHQARLVYPQTRLDEFLYIATLNEQKAMIELLLFLEANPHEKIFNNQTAFYIAKNSGNLGLLELLENPKFLVS